MLSQIQLKQNCPANGNGIVRGVGKAAVHRLKKIPAINPTRITAMIKETKTTGLSSILKYQESSSLVTSSDFLHNRSTAMTASSNVLPITNSFSPLIRGHLVTFCLLKYHAESLRSNYTNFTGLKICKNIG